MKAILGLLFLIVSAAPVAAQSIAVVSTHPPLSPEEAVAVLRGSHSIADYTDYRSSGSGPTIVEMGPSTTPLDWPPAAFMPTPPLAYDSGFYTPAYQPFYQANYAPRYGVYPRAPHSRARNARPVAAPRPRAEPVHLVMQPARAAGRSARGR